MILKTRGGDFNSFFTSSMVFVVSLACLWVFYSRADGRWTEIWGSYLTKEVREHSPIGTKGWKAFDRGAEYPFFLLLPVIWMFAAYCIQRVLPEKIAKTFNRIHAIALLALALTVAYSFYTMLTDTATATRNGGFLPAKYAKYTKISE